MSEKNHKVLVTGLGIISALGLDLAENWANLCAGKSGIREITLFDASKLQTRIAAQVSGSFEEYAKEYCKKRISHQMTRVTRFCYVCALDAVARSGIDFDAFDRSRCGVILGAVTSGNSTAEQGTTAKNRIIKGMSNSMSAWISMHFGLEGPNFVVNTACASSAYAMSLAHDLIASGRADLVIAGGADSTINYEEIEGFNELYALSTFNEDPVRASRPFSAERDGFVIGEGAGIVILESEKSAIRRKADVYAEFAGYALTSEAYNIMSPKKDGEGMVKTMRLALENSGTSPEDIDYINAHGTSTTLNDKYETMAIREVFGSRAGSIPVSSVKSMIGHTIGAAGAIEAAITSMSVRNDMVAPTMNLERRDPELDLDFVPGKARRHVIRNAISNSFAFGGHNATIVLRKYTAQD